MPNPNQENPRSGEAGPSESGRFADELGLPPRLRQNALPSTAQYYGFHRELASRGRVAGPPPGFRAHWQHGWCVAERQQIDPALVVLENELKHDLTYYVARQDEAAYLENLGYQAKAAGLPIVYTDETVERRPGSLLIMPVHSLEYTEHQWKFQETIDELVAAAASYNEVVACIHPACYQHGYWLTELAGHGIPFVIGAEAWDANGLRRVARLFQSFETIVSNGFGSHIAYALAFGARACIFGPTPEIRKEDVAKAPFFQKNPHIVKPMGDLLGAKAMQARYPWLYTHPADAQTKREWARHEIGWENRLGRGEIFSLLHSPPQATGKKPAARQMKTIVSNRFPKLSGMLPETFPEREDSLPLRIGLASSEPADGDSSGSRPVRLLAAAIRHAAEQRGGTFEWFAIRKDGILSVFPSLRDQPIRVPESTWDNPRKRRELLQTMDYDLVVDLLTNPMDAPGLLIDGDEPDALPDALLSQWRECFIDSDAVEGEVETESSLRNRESFGEALWDAITTAVLEQGRANVEAFVNGAS